MRNSLVAGAVALALGLVPAAHAVAATAEGGAGVRAGPVDPELVALRQELQRLSERLRELEAKQQDAAARAEAAVEKQSAIEARVAEVETGNDNQTDSIAQAQAKVASADWASRIKLSGDARYRNEHIRRDLRTDQARDRIRARLGLAARVNDTVTVGLRLASGADDPRSSMQTLGAGGAAQARRAIGIDQFYVAWQPVAGLTVQGGKFALPYWRPGQSLLNDGDLNPEGVSVSYQRGLYYGNAFGFRLTERGTAAVNPDTGAVGAISRQQQGSVQAGLQLGVKVPVGAESTLQAAVMYTDLGAGQGRQPFWFATATTTAAVAANGNSVDASGGLLYDFGVVQLSAEFGTRVGALPLALWADYAKNDGARNGLDQAYGAGVTLGRASDARSWEIGYAYGKHEKDGYFGQFIDSDFGAGFTDTKGSVVRLGYAPAKNWTLNATYTASQLNVSGTTPAASARRGEDYRRLQLDFNVKY